MKPNQAAEGGVHEDSTPLVEHDAKEDAATKPAFAGPEEGENRSDAEAVSEAAPEPSKTLGTSLRKIEANRSNALKSTGPRTPSGKSRVSQNARTHGIFSRRLLSRDGDASEDPREYAQLYAAVHQHYKPEGQLEELLVDKIAAWNWRLTRVVRCETGQIDRALVAHRFQVKQAEAQMANSPDMSALHNHEEDSIVADLLLPSNGEMDKLLRYEESISKQLDRVTAELDRLQARRKGAAQVSGDSAKQSH